MDLIESLAHFALPLVAEHLGTENVLDYVGPLSVEYGESSPFAEIYFIRVPIKDDTTAGNVCALAQALNAYCQNEDTDAIYSAPEFTCDGREWMIGDGDDGGAVVFHGKAFRIWLRSFAADTRTRTYGFTVSREDDGEERDYGTEDEAERALQTLGYRNTGSGTNLITGTRDLDFESDTPLSQAHVEAIKARLEDATGIAFDVTLWA